MESFNTHVADASRNASSERTLSAETDEVEPDAAPSAGKGAIAAIRASAAASASSVLLRFLSAIYLLLAWSHSRIWHSACTSDARM